MSSLEFEGKNVDKTVKSASDELNIAPDKLNYEVLSSGSSGIFGFGSARKARIRVNLPESPPETGLDAKFEINDTPLHEEPVQADAQVSELDISDGLQPHPFAKTPLDLAQDVLQRIIDAITSDATIAAEETQGRLRLNVAGGNAGVLIGKKGQTLEAIQSLVDKIVNKHHNHNDKIRVQVDVEGYLATRELNLEKLALRLADKSKRIRKPISLGQLNGYDRRIVHLVLKDDPDVQTRSRGEGYMRKLVIFPKKNSSHSMQASHK